MKLGLRHALLALIVLSYFVLGLLFAFYTPAWQAPDEPAHYNYVRYLAELGRFPVLHMGDYPHAFLEEIKSRGFPPDLSIDPIRYEFHQPPLYYSLAAVLYVLTSGALPALRLFSVLLGAGVVLCAYGVARRFRPDWPAMALGAAAFVAFLPQHLTTVSQVGNDVLAELLFALVLYQLVGWTMKRARAQMNPDEDADLRSSALTRVPSSGFLGVGILLGLSLVTKTTAYVAVPLAAGVLIWRWWEERAGARQIVAELLLVSGPAALIALPWYARNLSIYGWPDFLALRRHDVVVVGQLRTAEYLAQHGWGSYLQRLGEFTFKSFWGVFGWLGVFMDSRVYFTLALLSAVALAGLGLRFVRRERTEVGADRAHRGLGVATWLLVANVLLTVLIYGWYNLTFVQHQGRYLFTALIPIAIGFAAGWDEVLRPRNSRPVAFGLVAASLILAAWGLVGGAGLPKWPIAITWIAALGLAIRPYLPRRLDPLLFALPYLAFPLLDLYALFGAIVPQLAHP
jgi:4-amino-4-deoxy-L-arabinose transferase-like glycosyltransferase